VGLVPDGNALGGVPERIVSAPGSPSVLKLSHGILPQCKQLAASDQRARLLLERMQSAPWRNFRWIIESEQAGLMVDLVRPADRWRVPQFEGRCRWAEERSRC